MFKDIYIPNFHYRDQIVSPIIGGIGRGDSGRRAAPDDLSTLTGATLLGQNSLCRVPSKHLCAVIFFLSFL